MTVEFQVKKYPDKHGFRLRRSPVNRLRQADIISHWTPRYSGSNNNRPFI